MVLRFKLSIGVNHTIETSNKRRGPNTSQFEQSHHLTEPLVAT